MEEIYMQGDSVTITNQVCNDNEPLSKMIRVKLFKQSMTGKYEGWALYNELIKKSEFKEYRIQQDIRDKKANKYGDSIKALKQKTKYSRPLWVLSVTADDYTDQSMGITVTFLNTSKKIIKYINFTVVPYNQVDDPVIDDMGVSTKACQLIGPIEPDETVSYQKDILFFSSVISYYKLKNINIQFMDNSIQYLNYKDILKKEGQF